MLFEINISSCFGNELSFLLFPYSNDRQFLINEILHLIRHPGFTIRQKVAFFFKLCSRLDRKQKYLHMFNGQPVKSLL